MKPSRRPVDQKKQQTQPGRCLPRLLPIRVASVEVVDANSCVVTVGPLTGCSTASELDLNLNGPIFTLNGSILIAPLTITLPLLLDDPTVKAKFSKKNATLTVTATGKLP